MLTYVEFYYMRSLHGTLKLWYDYNFLFIFLSYIVLTMFVCLPVKISQHRLFFFTWEAKMRWLEKFPCFTWTWIFFVMPCYISLKYPGIMGPSHLLYLEFLCTVTPFIFVMGTTNYFLKYTRKYLTPYHLRNVDNFSLIFQYQMYIKYT